MCKFLQPSPNPVRRLPPPSIVRERECKLVVCVTSFHATQPLVITASVHRSCLISAVSQYIRSCPFALSPLHAHVLQWRTTAESNNHARPLRSSFPSLPRHLHHHHSFTHTLFFSSQYMPIHFNLLSYTFLDTSPSFAVST